MSALAGSIAWVTGAGSGIGLAGAQALAAAGATVVMSGRRADVLEREARAIRAGGGHAQVAALDVTDAAAVAEAAAVLLARHGRIDILVNSAGMNTPTRFWKDQTVAGWNQVVRANLDGCFNTVHAVLPAMRSRRAGLIINVSSWSGVYHPKLSGAAYNAAKHGVVAMTETINMEECTNGIRACALCPAETATPIMDHRPIPPSPEERARMLQPDDLGAAIRFIAELPPRACVNQLVISPTWNRVYLGGEDLK